MGGPTMIRAAAKNHKDVWVVVDPADYVDVIDAIDGKEDRFFRRRLTAKCSSISALTTPLSPRIYLIIALRRATEKFWENT